MSVDFAGLKSNLSQSATARKDDALYKTLQYLIERLTKFQDANSKSIADLSKPVSTSQSTTTSNLINKTSVTLNDIQIKALPTSGFELIGPQGTGKRIYLIALDFVLNLTAGIYTGVDVGAILSAQLGGVTITPTLDATNLLGTTVGILQATLFPTGSQLQTDISTFKNAALRLYTDNAADFTDGNATNSMTITSFYIIL